MIGGFVYTLLDQRLGSLSSSEQIRSRRTCFASHSQPLFLLGSLFILVVYFVPGGLVSLPARAAGLRRAKQMDVEIEVAA